MIIDLNKTCLTKDIINQNDLKFLFDYLDYEKR
jgi:hypothetical protein